MVGDIYDNGWDDWPRPTYMPIVMMTHQISHHGQLPSGHYYSMHIRIHIDRYIFCSSIHAT